MGNEFGTASELSARNECGRPSAAFPRLEGLAVPLSHALNQDSDFGLRQRKAMSRPPRNDVTNF
jgi:hypothetical protein